MCLVTVSLLKRAYFAKYVHKLFHIFLQISAAIVKNPADLAIIFLAYCTLFRHFETSNNSN